MPEPVSVQSQGLGRFSKFLLGLQSHELESIWDYAEHPDDVVLRIACCKVDKLEEWTKLSFAGCIFPQD